MVSKAVLFPRCHHVFAAKRVAALQTLYPLLTSVIVKILTIVVITLVAENANLVAAKVIVSQKIERRRSPRIPKIQVNKNLLKVRAKAKEAKAGTIKEKESEKSKEAKDGTIQKTVISKAR